MHEDPNFYTSETEVLQQNTEEKNTKNHQIVHHNKNDATNLITNDDKRFIMNSKQSQKNEILGIRNGNKSFKTKKINFDQHSVELQVLTEVEQGQASPLELFFLTLGYNLTQLFRRINKCLIGIFIVYLVVLLFRFWILFVGSPLGFRWYISISNICVYPFNNIFPIIRFGPSIIELGLFVALIVYGSVIESFRRFLKQLTAKKQRTKAVHKTKK